jgi:hypothetical protein
LAVMIVPSILNSITACDLLIAADCANASRAAELLFHKGIKKTFSNAGTGVASYADDAPSGSPLTRSSRLQALTGW